MQLGALRPVSHVEEGWTCSTVWGLSSSHYTLVFRDAMQVQIVSFNVHRAYMTYEA